MCCFSFGPFLYIRRVMSCLSCRDVARKGPPRVLNFLNSIISPTRYCCSSFAEERMLVVGHPPNVFWIAQVPKNSPDQTQFPFSFLPGGVYVSAGILHQFLESLAVDVRWSSRSDFRNIVWSLRLLPWWRLFTGVNPADSKGEAREGKWWSFEQSLERWRHQYQQFIPSHPILKNAG